MKILDKIEEQLFKLIMLKKKFFLVNKMPVNSEKDLMLNTIEMKKSNKMT
jgi:hypothetical protein